MKPNQLMKNRNITYAMAIAYFGLPQRAQAVAPGSGHGYAGDNEMERRAALLRLSVGSYNTAVGLFALLSNTGDNFNIAISTGIVLSDTVVALFVIPWLVRAFASAKAIWRALTDGQERKQQTTVRFS
jgi:hypothetical protein